MKRVLLILLPLTLFCLLPISASAEEDYIGQFSDIVGDMTYTDPDFLSEALTIEKIFSDISDKAATTLLDIAPRLLTLLGLSVLSALATLYDGRYKEGVSFGISVVVTLTATCAVADVFLEITDSMSKISALFSSMIPLFSAVTLSGGGGYTAAGLSVGMASTVSLFSGIITPLFVSLLAAMLALSLLSPFGVGSVSALTQGVKRHTLLIITLVGAVLLGTVSLQTVFASARDNAAMRAAKHLAQTVLPVVGSTVSASLSTLWSGLALTKGIIGIGGILVIVGMLIGPLVTLLIYKLAIGIITAAEGFLSVSSPLSRISECLDMLIGVYSVSAVIYIFEIVLFINGGVNLS